MINKFSTIILFVSGIILPQTLSAQFINLQITIEPELSAEVERVLNFGEVVSNSGIKEIKIGDLNTGVFSIRAIRSQSLYIELNYPDALSLENNEKDNIPLQLKAAYNNSGNNNIANAQDLPNNSGVLLVGDLNNNSESFWHKLYIYVYGYIDVGNIPNGVYKGDLVLFISYD